MKRDMPTPVINPEKIRALHAPGGVIYKRRAIGWSGGAEPIQAPENVPLNFICGKCNGQRTTGIYLKESGDFRICPSCSSILMFCPVCGGNVSGTEKFKLLTCNTCHTDFITDTTIQSLIEMDRSAREIVLSGIRATNRLHIGNYLGAIKQFVKYATGDNLCMYFIADWHTLTDCQDPTQIANSSLAIATDYLAAGLDPERSIIYAQSSVPEIAELSLYLSMFQKQSELEILPTIKGIMEKLEKEKLPMTLGLLTYPVLMAADILGPKATLVPVGADQVSHVELASKIAKRFNRRFGPTFVVPRAAGQQLRVPGLSDTGKMAKSDEGTCIFLDDPPEVVREKYVRHAVSDKAKVKRNDPGKPENCPAVYPMYQILCEDKPEVVAEVCEGCKSGKRGCFDCKVELARLVSEMIAPLQERRKEFQSKRKFVLEVLHFGGLKVREIIRPTLELVREKLGIIVK